MCKPFIMATVATVFVAGTAVAVNIETVPVGNPGNARDTWQVGYGAVAYTYNIGKYPVTARQYTAFLNAVAKTDTYGLYNERMWSDTLGCKIQQSGTPGSYTYSVASNRPVNFVSWGDAARFANWLHNGQLTGAQGAGTTETGAYTLNGAMTDTELMAVTRNADWKWAITSEDEWYKAAYHKNDGVTGNYWLYPTSSDLMNIGDANFGMFVGHPTDVGAYSNPSPYGTFDQGGNVWEWNEAVFYGSDRGLRGGSFGSPDHSMRAESRLNYAPTHEISSVGFRIVQVPEPGAVLLVACGAFAARRRGSVS